jgi:hypothetical protein
MEFPLSSHYYVKKRENEPSDRDINDEFMREKIMEVLESEGEGK